MLAAVSLIPQSEIYSPDSDRLSSVRGRRTVEVWKKDMEQRSTSTFGRAIERGPILCEE
jgi:hypothetical protein